MSLSSSSSTFLTKVATLRDFLDGMGFHVNNDNNIHGNDKKITTISERELCDTLKNCGYVVEAALERIIMSLSLSSTCSGPGQNTNATKINTTNDDTVSNCKVNDGATSAATTTTTTTTTSAISTTTWKTSKSISTSFSSKTTISKLITKPPLETPKNNSNNTNKRLKINHANGGGGGGGRTSSKTKSGGTTIAFHNNSISADRDNNTATTTNHPNRRLLLCKRWTVAISTNPQRGGCNVRYGEMLDFGENFTYTATTTPTTTAQQGKGILGSSGKKLNQLPRRRRRQRGGGERGGSTLGKDHMVVRFRSHSSSSFSSSREAVGRSSGSTTIGESIIQGTLSRYLSSILSPLLRYLPPDDDDDDDSSFHSRSQLISIEGKTMMEDYGLVIGSEIPIVLEVYINDPLQFFGLFHSQQQLEEDVSGRGNEGASSFAHLKGGGKKKKTNNVSSDSGYIAEAAFRLLQWAEKGGEEEEAFTLAQRESVVIAENTEEQGLLGSVTKNLVNCVNPSSFSTSKDVDYDLERIGSAVGEENVIVLEEEGEIVVDEEEADNKLSQLFLSSALDDNKNYPSQSKTLPELSDPKGFRPDIALRPYQRQALYFMCRREGVFISGEMGEVDGDNDVDEELNSLMVEQLTPSAIKGNPDASKWVWDGDEETVANCNCGPVVVRNDTVASSAVPVIGYNSSLLTTANWDSRKQGKYIHHPLWQRRFLVAADDFNSVFAFYVNELMGIASARPPNPPKMCSGGILADSMGLGKTVMLLALILKTKEQEVGTVFPKDQLETSALTPQARRGSCRKMVASEDESESEYQKNHDDDDNDDESWVDKKGSALAKELPSINAEKSKGTTLVIAPLSLVSQWEEELSTKTNLSHLLYYDSTTKRRVGGYDFACVDVVITTYGTVQSLFETKLRSGSVETRQRHPMFNFAWKRIILDEAHVTKNPGTLVSKACCTLTSESRWCVTGTPIQNSLQDVYGLLKFLRHEPWCDFAFWRNAVIDFAPEIPACSRDLSKNSVDVNVKDDGIKDFSSVAAFGRVRRLLAPILLRRTKSTLAEDGTPIVILPPIDYSVVHVALSSPERQFYNALLERSQTIFEGFLNAGTASKSWFAIFSLLQRLRQACDHVSLTVTKSTKSESGDSRVEVDSVCEVSGGDAVDNDFLSRLLLKFKNTSSEVNTSTGGEPNAFAKQVAEKISICVQSSDEFLNSECPVCLEEPRVEDAVYTPCAHMFCRECIISVFREQIIVRSKKSNVLNVPDAEGHCPVCHSFVKQSSIVQISRTQNGQAVSKFLDPLPDSEKENSLNVATHANRGVSAARLTLESAINGARSSKLQAILSELEKVRNDSKVLIFSQYLGFLDIIGTALEKLGVQCFRIDGSMSLKERVSAMSNFNKSQSGSVMLISMKAGGVGLNLVAASSVFIVDPWWNQALEDQCINRVHRIGQRAKIVRIRKFVVIDSVEEKIVTLQAKKKGMANEILSEGDDGGQLDGAAKPSLDDFKLLLGR